MLKPLLQRAHEARCCTVVGSIMFQDTGRCGSDAKHQVVLCIVQADEEAFLEGVRQHGRDAKLIARDMGNRTIGAVKKFYQKNRKCATHALGVPCKLLVWLCPPTWHCATTSAIDCSALHLAQRSFRTSWHDLTVFLPGSSDALASTRSWSATSGKCRLTV